MDEPLNATFKSRKAYCPTYKDNHPEVVNIKQNFSCRLERPKFKGKIKVPVRFANGKTKSNADGTMMEEELDRDHG